MYNTQIITRANEDGIIEQETLFVLYNVQERYPEEMDIVVFLDENDEPVINCNANFVPIFTTTESCFNYIHLN